ncbi:MAG: hypothetical protein ACK4VW_01325 [Anaerolineales bacterium]
MRPTAVQWLHAFKQAPWRVQRQWMALLLAFILLGMTLEAISLQASSRAALLGREIQNLRAEAARLERLNADLRVALAAQTRVDGMEQRARRLGFRPPEPQEREFLIVPGYLSPSSLTTLTRPSVPNASLPPEYTQSLWDWLQDRFVGLAAGGTP